MTFAQCAAQASVVLARAGVPADDSRRDAAVIARHVLGWDMATWLTRSIEQAPERFVEQHGTLVARRIRREPLAYIVGEREFYGRPFRVARGVLIPRPETELVIDEAVRAVGELTRTPVAHPSPHLLVALDVGTGSGCLAITLALEAPALRIVASDTSAAALDVARENARRLGVQDRIEFQLAPLAASASRPVDLIVANPPYVPETDRASLPPEVRDWEPPEALFAGPDGLDVIRELLPAAAGALRPGGFLVMEIGDGQDRAVAELIAACRALSLSHIARDLQGIPRVLVAVGTG